MKPCPKCGWMLKDDDAKCVMCGESVAGGAPPPVAGGGYGAPAAAPGGAYAPPVPVGGAGGYPQPNPRPPPAVPAVPMAPPAPAGGYGASPAPAPFARAAGGEASSPWAAAGAAPPAPVRADGVPARAPQPPPPPPRGGAPAPPPRVDVALPPRVPAAGGPGGPPVGGGYGAAPLPPLVSPGPGGEPRPPPPVPVMGSTSSVLAPPPVPDAQGAPVLVGFLVTFQNEPTGKFWPLRSGRTSLGRRGVEVEADVSLADASCSARHAVIGGDPSTGQAFIEDLGSRNGTFVNEQRLSKGAQQQLRDNDRLRLGSITLVVKLLASG
ncbi:MAG: FHA domain-containing protein [Deltaproteobacteria bacterium]|nr:FHA domain-containing protein [Deltaproteobacteria bacterium]